MTRSTIGCRTMLPVPLVAPILLVGCGEERLDFGRCQANLGSQAKHFLDSFPCKSFLYFRT